MGNSEIINVEKTTMIEETNQKCYGGEHTFISYYPSDELQSMYKEMVIEGNLNNTFDKAKYPLDTWDNDFTLEKLKVIGSFKMHSEGCSFLFKECFMQNVPTLLQF